MGARYTCETTFALENTQGPSRKEKTVKYHRLTTDPNQMGGVPCIRGLRIPVATVVGMVAEGMKDEEILQAYPDLEPEDIREALRFSVETYPPLRSAHGYASR